MGKCQLQQIDGNVELEISIYAWPDLCHYFPKASLQGDPDKYKNDPLVIRGRFS